MFPYQTKSTVDENENILGYRVNHMDHKVNLLIIKENTKKMRSRLLKESASEVG